MQLRYSVGVKLRTYVNQKCWLKARLSHCPDEGCRCRPYRHGYYARKTRCGQARIARFRCRSSGLSYSLLPDYFAARMPGTLEEIEQTVVALERGATSLQAALAVRDRVHEDSGLRRWARRRNQWIGKSLVALVTLLGRSQVLSESFYSFLYNKKHHVFLNKTMAH